MSDIRAQVFGTPNKATDGTVTLLHATPYGDLFSERAMLGYSIAGRLFGAHFGSVTTPLTRATAAIVVKRPQAWVEVPDGTAIIPLVANVVVEGSGAAQGEVAICTAQNDVGTGISSAGTSGVLSLNTAAPVVSTCTVRQLATGDVTAETNRLELRRFSWAASDVNQNFNWNARESLVVPVLRGPASFLIYIGGNTVTFYAQMQWLELPETVVTS